MIDAHCHLYDEKFDEIRDEVIKELESSKQICVCSADNVEHSLMCIDLATKSPFIYATIGTHPHEVIEFSVEDLETYKTLSKNKKVVAIGEIGLDYYYDKDTQDRQKEVLLSQIKLADELSLPCVFHVREAMGDFLEIVKENKKYFKNSGVIHSFSGSVETARELIKLGYYLGVGGILTFKNSKLVDVIKSIPIEYILLETDSPFLTPEPFRKYKNEPKYIPIIAEKLAQLKEIDVNEVMKITTNNANSVFDFS